MGNVYAVIISLVMLLSASQQEALDNVKNGFARNDSEMVLKSTESKLLMNVLGKESVYSKTQASLVLSEYFKQYPKGSFNYVFQSPGNDDGLFGIGTYKSQSKSFRVTVHFKKAGSKLTLENLSIEAD